MSIGIQPSSDYVALLTNCLIAGEEVEDDGNGSKVRSLIRLSLERWDVEIHQRPELIVGPVWSTLRGQNKVTTTATVRAVSPADELAVDQLVQELAELLMFATGSEVGVHGRDYAGGNPSSRRQSVMGEANDLHPVIKTRDGFAVREYLGRVHAGYKAHRSSRKLPEVFHYLSIAGRASLPMEPKLAMLFIVLEQLKHSFALASNYRFIDGYFYLPGAPGAPKGKRQGFKALLIAMFNVVGMAPSVDAIIDLRNEILHSGLSALSIMQQAEEEEKLQAIVREYLLRLIGYCGSYYTGHRSGQLATLP